MDSGGVFQDSPGFSATVWTGEAARPNTKGNPGGGQDRLRGDCNGHGAPGPPEILWGGFTIWRVTLDELKSARLGGICPEAAGPDLHL